MKICSLFEFASDARNLWVNFWFLEIQHILVLMKLRDLVENVEDF